MSYGVSGAVQGDMSFGYTLPLFNVEIEKQGVMFNPSVFFEIA